MSLPEFKEIGEKVKGWQADETRYYRSLPLKNYFYAAVALAGIVATCLPWADVIVYFAQPRMAVGLHFFIGWLIFLIYLAVFVIVLFNKQIKINENNVEKLPLYASIITSSLTAIFLIWNLFHVRYGVYLCLFISLLFLFLTWHFAKKYKNSPFKN